MIHSSGSCLLLPANQTLAGNDSGSTSLVPAIPMGDLDWILISGVLPDLLLSIWGMGQWIGTCSLALP